MDVAERIVPSARVSEGADASASAKTRTIPPKTLAGTDDRVRQGKIGPLGYSHCAIRSRDVEATRHFYEDVIGLPLVLVERGKQIRFPPLDEPFDMMHYFFELADGTSIGFFGVEEGKMEPHIMPNHPIQFHFAVQMESEAAVREAEVRVRSAGYECNFMDHGAAFSLYIHDPDGIQLELCYHRPDWFAAIDVEEADASFNEWVANGGRWQ